ncbi:MAG: hypothetical protein ACTS5I_16325 [Rhodanobacter sp.]
MSLVLTIQETADGLWRISREQDVLFAKLHLASAIRRARGLAREEHVRTGLPACVEMQDPDFTIMLAEYASLKTQRGLAAAA